jgi:hypothetical protein
MRVLEIEHGGRRVPVLTFLTDEEIAHLSGLPPQAIIGQIDDDGRLHVNAVFREFLHEIIAAAAPLDPAMQQAAAARGSGRLVYIDDRAPAGLHPVPDEDILGWFRIEDGRILPGSYLPNPNHAISGRHGLTAAVNALRVPLLRALAR